MSCHKCEHIDDIQGNIEALKEELEDMCKKINNMVDVLSHLTWKVEGLKYK